MHKEKNNIRHRAESRGLVRKNSFPSVLRSEKGLALATVLVLSLITLAIISALIYMVIQGTTMSGTYKRYGTANEAAVGGAELGADLINERGDLSNVFLGLWSSSGNITGCDCGDPDNPNDNLDDLGVRTCLCDKLCDSTADWPAACSMSLDPTDNPDMVFNLWGINTTYEVSLKIVDTIRGNSDLSGERLGGTAVVSSTSGIIPAPPLPYLHRIEVNSEDITGVLRERARISALYAF